MVDSLDNVLDGLLAAADAGVPINGEWIRERFPTHATMLHGSLLLAGLPHQEPPVPRLLGPCRLLHEIGRGGMGIVFSAELLEAAWGLNAGTRVAVKVLYPGLAERHRMATALEDERRLGTTVCHPNVVRAYGASVESHQDLTWFCLFMELVEGTVLDRFQHGEMHATEALLRHVGLGVTAALHEIHTHDVVHRDVKPHNIIVTKDNEVRLMDLGAACLTNLDESRFAGSLPYAAPEQFVADSRVDGRADLYALGATMAELALGERRQRSEALRLPGRFSPFIEAFVMQLLAREPAHRFPTAADAHITLLEGDRSDWWRARSSATSIQRPPLGGHRLLERQRERAVLSHALHSARDGAGQAILIRGDAGIGKSALIADLMSEAGDARLGRYDPGAAESGIAAIFRQLPDLARHLGALRAQPELVTALRDWINGAAARHIPSEAKLSMLRELLAATLRDGPLVLVIEDLHFAPADDVAIVRDLVARLPHGPLLLVCSTRPLTSQPWSDLFGPALLDIPILSNPSIQELLRRAAFPATLRRPDFERMAQEAAGNPQVALLLLAAEDRPDVPPQTDAEEPGTSVLRALARRRAFLSMKERSLLETAACAGFQFDTQTLARAAGTTPAELRQELTTQPRMRDWFVPRESGFAFDHHLTHAGLLDLIAPQRRAECHTALALALESGGDQRRLAELVTHAVRGGCADLTRKHLHGAATQLLGRGQPHAARTLLHEALGTTLIQDTRERFDFLRLHADLLMNLERGPEAGEQLRECAILARQLDAEARATVLVDQADLARLVIDIERSERCARRALTALDEAKIDNAELRGAIYHALMSAADHQQRWNDVTVWTRRLRRLRVPLARLVSLQSGGKQRLDFGRRQSAARALRGAVAVAEAQGNEPWLMHTLVLLGIADQMRGLHRAAQLHFRRALRLANRHHIRGTAAIALGRIGAVAFARGRPGRALALTNESITRLESTSQLPMLVSTLVAKANMLLSLGDATGARAAAERAHTEGSDLAATRFKGLALASLARIEWLSDDRARAGQLFEEARGIFHRAGWIWAEVETSLEWAQVLWLDRRFDQAASLIQSTKGLMRPSDGPDAALLSVAWAAMAGQENPTRGEALLRQHANQLSVHTRMRICYLLWSCGCGDEYVEAARQDLDRLVRFAQPRYRSSMSHDVILHRFVRTGVRLWRPQVNGLGAKPVTRGSRS